MTATAAVVVTHGPSPDLETCLAALEPQVDELIVVANLVRETPEVPPGVRLIVNEQPVGFAANVNLGMEATKAPLVVVANPDAVARFDTVKKLASFVEAHDRCGVAGPQLLFPDGTWQPSARRFPTVAGTLMRRTPLRLLFPPYEYNRSHYRLDEGIPTEPVPADWMLAAFWMIRRSAFEALGGMDEGFRLYGEDIDFCYRAEQMGWQRWYVPGAVVVHRHAAVTDYRFFDRHTMWHLAGVLRFVRKHPETLKALR